MAEHPHAALVRKGFEAFSRGDMDTLRELIAKDATHHVPGNHPLSGDFKGQDAIMDMYRRLGEETAGAAQRKAEAHRRAERLTQRERDVLLGLIHGNSNKETAMALGISPRTVEIHRGNMMARLNARSTGDAVRMGLEAGLAG